jgi:hypothetical protein
MEDQKGDQQAKLKFEVSMNIQPMDLNIDLVAFFTLMGDNDDTVQAMMWDAPYGGHQVTGTLDFPARLNGKPAPQGVKRLTVKITTFTSGSSVLHLFFITICHPIKNKVGLLVEY